MLAVVAAVCDVVENVFLLAVLDGRGGATAPAVARAFATVKFVILALVIGYLVVAAALLAWAWFTDRSRSTTT